MWSPDLPIPICFPLSSLCTAARGSSLYKHKLEDATSPLKPSNVFRYTQVQTHDLQGPLWYSSAFQPPILSCHSHYTWFRAFHNVLRFPGMSFPPPTFVWLMYNSPVVSLDLKMTSMTTLFLIQLPMLVSFFFLFLIYFYFFGGSGGIPMLVSHFIKITICHLNVCLGLSSPDLIL